MLTATLVAVLTGTFLLINTVIAHRLDVYDTRLRVRRRRR